MAEFVIHHQHLPDECAIAYAAWRGFASPLRGRPAPASCLSGGHGLWWQVRAANADAALALLPRYVAERARAWRVTDVLIP